jgi:predicted SAM-dependent methyltransferase
MKLHLGCGNKHIDGFYHIDALPYGHVDHVGPVDNLPQIDSDTVDLIYACHVLEHFGRNDYRRVLQEWFRVLRPSGVLRVAVPDFAAVAEVYVRGGAARGIEDVVGLCVGGQRDEYDFHKMIFDEELLTRVLLETGFSHVRHWDWRQTEHKDLDDYSQAYLPHMDKERGTLMSLNLEAVK